MSLTTIPCDFILNHEGVKESIQKTRQVSQDFHRLALEAYRLTLNDSLENLLCLPRLKGIIPFWYQTETAKKVIRSFQGRALLADEVGLGKTIEASMVLKEYILRGLVKSALILVPSPLVSQWREELKTKFDLEFRTTDDRDFEPGSEDFWQSPWILASLSTAKSKKNYFQVVAREYDLIIVDEAHHLKNRESLNWRLVNDLKKRFLLLLTATPVENNLIELHNLITLLKAGQLKTQAAFQREFIERGNHLKPKNPLGLKDLLREVMIRNTRAVANIHLPPRHAETLAVEPSAQEAECYQRLTGLVRRLRKKEQGRSEAPASQLWLNTLLAQAGSSLGAVEKTISGMRGRDTWPQEYREEAELLVKLCRQSGESSKETALLKLLREGAGKKVVFVKYRRTLETLSQHLSRHDIRHALFHGQMSNAEKDSQIAAFAAEGPDSTPILLATESGGEGKNLQFCHTLINFDLPWNPMKIEQRIGRLHRIGQEHEVQVYNLCAKGSLEDYLLDLLDRKINMFEMVVGEVEMILGRLVGVEKGDAEFDEIVFDIWSGSSNEEEVKKGFDQLASQLVAAKQNYLQTKEWCHTVLDRDYES